VIQTVLGPVEPEQLGIVLPHEHVFVDLTSLFVPPREAGERGRAHRPFSLEHLGWIRYHYFSHWENLLLDDEETAISELALFKRAGGGTIVDVGPPDIGRDPLALARVARASGVNVVMATGHYVQGTHPAWLAGASAAEIAARMVTELREGAILDRSGVAGQDVTRPDVRTDVRAGVIKVGCSYPLTDGERKVLEAAAEAQRATGAPITIHVGRHDRSAPEIVDALRQAGADLGNTIIGHLDLRIERLETLDEVAASGCFLEFDLFGQESSYFANAPRDMPSDAQRLDLLEHVKGLGLVDRILISHDICNKHRLTRYGGHGYSYIPERVAPRLRERGFDADEVHAILIANPARALSFTPLVASA
jgi:phosphotriesterase-related protein